MLSNMPYRTFSIINCGATTISGLTRDASTGASTDENTDGFDLQRISTAAYIALLCYNSRRQLGIVVGADPIGSILADPEDLNDENRLQSYQV
ncbi:hypothetical protein PF003_g3500 [Phytophthora fragariae]|nr:hypothetical protein PF003_g3500 [Phytophthora fragariae]